MKHLILGTAGHIDHGKTALVRALSGIDCDTHKEEKRRGITINLGFAHLDLPSGLSMGIVDVPGHKDFVHTMVGGASGIDLALLVVAADSGVMPQTREHLQIMDVLRIRAGLVALTKVDLVEPDIAAMAEEEVRELVSGTFLEDCPILHTSAETGTGLDQLKTELDRLGAAVEPRPAGEVFRMFVDRIFSVSGFGTVVTGSVLSGRLCVEDTAFLLPGAAKELRVRRLERHGQPVDEVVAGDRASINVVGLDRADFSRGMILADRALRETRMLDASLRVFPHGRAFRLWSHVLFHLGTFESRARLHLLDRDRLDGGETALVQIHPAGPCVAQYGDKFVVRSSSSDITLGGGEIIDAAPLHHRRRPRKLIENMARIARGKLPELIVSEVNKRFRAVSHREIADILNIAPAQVLQVVGEALPEQVVSYRANGEAFLIAETAHNALREQTLKQLAAFHRRNPLQETGRSTEELMGVIGIAHESAGATLLRLMLEKMAGENRIKRVGHTWTLAEHGVTIGPEMKRQIEFVERFLRDSGMQTPLISELTREAKKRKIGEIGLHQILRYLVAQGRAYYVERNYLHAETVDSCRRALLTELSRREVGMTVAEFRDLVKGNRRICLLLLAIYDAEEVTERNGDLRMITEKGRERVDGG